LDREFAAFYQVLGSGQKPDEAAFDTAACDFFDAHVSSASSADDFFNNFIPVWNCLVSERRLLDAATVWEWALRPALGWEKRTAQRIHKGTPFYFAAMTAILAKDLDGGYLLAHRAFEEDMKTHATSSPVTPASALVVMDSFNVHQAFRQWVSAKAGLVSQALEVYRRQYGRLLDFSTLRSKFLVAADLREEVFLFSYSVARLLRLRDLGPAAFASDFGGQLGANLLFDVALVTDAIIRHVDRVHWKFIDLASTLSVAAGLGLSKRKLQEINRLFNSDFDGTVQRCLDGSLALSDGSAITGLSAALALTYGCRNRGAHDVAAVNVLRSRFHEVSAALLDTLFVAVEVLY